MSRSASSQSAGVVLLQIRSVFVLLQLTYLFLALTLRPVVGAGLCNDRTDSTLTASVVIGMPDNCVELENCGYFQFWQPAFPDGPPLDCVEPQNLLVQYKKIPTCSSGYCLNNSTCSPNIQTLTPECKCKGNDVGFYSGPRCATYQEYKENTSLILTFNNGFDYAKISQDGAFLINDPYNYSEIVAGIRLGDKRYSYLDISEKYLLCYNSPQSCPSGWTFSIKIMIPSSPLSKSLCIFNRPDGNFSLLVNYMGQLFVSSILLGLGNKTISFSFVMSNGFQYDQWNMFTFVVNGNGAANSVYMNGAAYSVQKSATDSYECLFKPLSGLVTEFYIKSIYIWNYPLKASTIQYFYQQNPL